MTEFFYDKWTIFPAFAMSGILLGLVYDVFRILRIARTYDELPDGKFFKKIALPKKAVKASKSRGVFRFLNSALIFVEDISFWIAAAFIETVFIYYFNNGEIRLDFFFYTAAGFFAYSVSVGKLIVFFAKKLIFFCRCLIFYILYIIIYPIKTVCSFIIGIVGKLGGKIYDLYDKRRSENAEEKLLKEAENGFGV